MAWESLDSNKNGVVTKGQLNQGLRSLEVYIDQIELDSLFSYLAPDNLTLNFYHFYLRWH